MKNLILYYSYTGHTKKIAEAAAAQNGSDIAEICDSKRPGTLKAYVLGSFAAMRGKAWQIVPLRVDMEAYETLHIYAPVWAGHVPPAVHAVLAQLPGGKRVSITLVSASGNSSCREKTELALQARNCSLDDFKDIQA